jgi:hypothetical protein
MDELIKKRVDESWKEQAEREKRAADTATPQAGQGPTQGATEARLGTEELPQARFDLFISGLGMEALIAMGDMPHPTTRKQAANFPQARYLIDLLGMLEEKTKGNLVAEEERLLKDTLYQLRMRYLAKAGG